MIVDVKEWIQPDRESKIHKIEFPDRLDEKICQIQALGITFEIEYLSTGHWALCLVDNAIEADIEVVILFEKITVQQRFIMMIEEFDFQEVWQCYYSPEALAKQKDDDEEPF